MPERVERRGVKTKPFNWLPWGIGAGVLIFIALTIHAVTNLMPAVPVLTSTPSATGKPALTATLAHTNTPSSTSTPVSTSTPELGIGSTMVRDKDQSIMVYVPAGEFLMGSDPAMDKDSQDDEQPQHSEYLDAYWIDQTEVTNGMYAVCVGAGLCKLPGATRSSSRSSYYGDSEYNDYPVVNVDWHQAKAYCAWAGAELPTEAQWEKAARGEDARIYPWGNNSPSCDLANYSNCKGDTIAVKSYESGKSPYGTYDMAGNVWEWVNDWFDGGYYNNSPASNPTGPTKGDGRVLRGGAWYGGVNDFRSAYRGLSEPVNRDVVIGFRCAFSNSTPAMTSTPSATGKPTLTVTLTHTNTPSSTSTPVSTSTPELGVGSTMVRDQDQSIMVYVPAGEFLMGSDPAMDKDSQDDEQPQHSEYLDAYWIDQTEVTNGMYALCVSTGMCDPPADISSSSRSSYYGDSEYNDYPVVKVDWNQAKAYCAWAGAELPTEAQWEKAARGEDARIYPWGNNSPSCDLANYSSCTGDTTAVKSYESGKSPYGAYDMAGNVWEWMNDWFDSGYYNNSPASNPTGPTHGDGRVLRGGAWYGGVNYFRSAYRYRYAPDSGTAGIGFRCALSK